MPNPHPRGCIRAVRGNQQGDAMPRRNQGAKLYWRSKRKCFVIAWTDESGSSRQRSTGTASRPKAEVIFAEWLRLRHRPNGPSDPDKILITDILHDYAVERGPKVTGKETL